VAAAASRYFRSRAINASRFDCMTRTVTVRLNRRASTSFGAEQLQLDPAAYKRAKLFAWTAPSRR
jgi:hypothetical protein